jgi:hypothetical protein
MIVPILALAGSLASKKLIPAGAGTFPVSGPLFTVLLIGTVLLVGLDLFSCPGPRANHRTLPNACGKALLMFSIRPSATIDLLSNHGR